MIPIRDVVPTRTPPRVTTALAIAHALVVLPAVIALTGVVFGRLTWVGAPPAVRLPLSVVFPPWWLPALGNVWVLSVLGGAVEDRLGHGRFVALYVLCGAAALAAQTFMSPLLTLPPAGAAGAVAGVLGAHVALFPQGRVLAAALVPWRYELVEPPALAAIGAWLMVQLFSGSDIIAVIGGALAGAAGGRLLVRRDRMQPDWWGAVAPDR